MPRKLKQSTNPFLKQTPTLLATLTSEVSILHRGIQFHQKGQLGAAERLYQQLLAIEPRNADALHLLGVIAYQRKNYQCAVDMINNAIECNSNVANYYSNLGNALQGLRLLDAAIASYDKAIILNPDHADAYSNRGNILQDLKKFDAAVASYEMAISLKPNYYKAYSNRGNALKELKQFEASLDSCDKAISLRPDYALAYSNKGNTLQELMKFDAAVASYDKAIELKPDFVDAYYNRGIALQYMQHFEAATASYEKAIALNPEFSDAFYSNSILKLSLRDFHTGFTDYKFRWLSKDFRSHPISTSLPSCKKSRLKGSLLIWAEQGIGDEIFFAGLLPELLKKDVVITLTADKRLHSIYSRSFPQINLIDKNLLMQSSVDSGFDLQSPVGDLGFLLDVDEASLKESRLPYLKSDSGKRSYIRKNLSLLGSRFVCGISWRSANEKVGTLKSIDLNTFEPLLTTPGIQFVNLQYGDVKNDLKLIKSKFSVDIHQVPGLDVFNDMDGLLALIDACDVVVTTSNVTAHLAGSIGKRAAVLVPFGKGRIWYWHHNDEYNFWYPTLRLFYQDNPFDWGKIIKDCTLWVRNLV